jgi:hypothetical protein
MIVHGFYVSRDGVAYDVRGDYVPGSRRTWTHPGDPECVEDVEVSTGANVWQTPDDAGLDEAEQRAIEDVLIRDAQGERDDAAFDRAKDLRCEERFLARDS